MVANTEYKRTWRAIPEVKARLKARRKVYRETEKRAHEARRSTPEGWARWAAIRVRYRAKHQGTPCEVTWVDLIPPAVCPVLGVRLRFVAGGDGLRTHPHAASVDRFNNALGYVQGNVRVISNRANLLKKDATLAEVRGLVRYMEGLQP